jgi:hypothetical protein
MSDIFTAFTNGVGDSIVNPRCDECRTPLSTPSIDQIGMPRLCRVCTGRLEQRQRTDFADYMSQERPRGRSIHIVKLPPGGLK